jgi:predicted ester cyclase
VEALIRRVFELVDACEWDRLGEVFAPDVVDHMGAGTAVGIDAFVEAVRPFYEMVPGLRHEVYDVIALADDVALFSVRATGPGLDIVVANAARIVDGRVQEHWGPGEQAMGQIMAQLGVSSAS